MLEMQKMDGRMFDNSGGPSSNRELLDTKGFCVIRNVIPKDQIDRLTKELKAHFKTKGRPRFGGKYDTRGFNLSPEVARILCSPPVMDVIKDCTSPDAPVLTGECDLTLNTTAGWHKDITENMKFGSAVYDRDDFAVYKMGIYLQDQPADAREVFKIKPGSHKLRDASAMPVIPLPVKTGDLVIFDLRLDHAGQVPSLPERVGMKMLTRLKGRLVANPDAAFTKLRAWMGGLLRPKMRFGIFVTFGPTTGAVYAYEQAARGYHGPILQPIDPDVRSSLILRGIEIIQVMV